MKKIAIVGLGFMGSMHAQVYQNLPEAQVVALADQCVEDTRGRAGKLGLDVPVYSSLTQLLDKEQVDVVDVCLPTDSHAAAVLEASERGKHIFCEKPIALSVEDGERMTWAARERGVFLMIGHCIRFWPEYDAVYQFVRAGKAGRLLSLSMQRRGGRPLGSRDHWLQDERRSMGAAMDLHIHDTDFVHHLLGTPKSVDSVGTRDASGLSHIFTDYEFDGMAVTAEGGWNYPAQWGFQMAFQAVFENGAVEFDSRAAQTLTVTTGEKPPQPLPFAAPKVKKSAGGEGNISSLGGYFRELEYFVGCLERGTVPDISTGEQAVRSLKTCLAEIRSCAERKRITV